MQKYKDELRAKKRKRLVLKLVGFLTAGTAVFTGLIYFLFFAGIFEVKSISIDTPDGLRANLSNAVNDWLDAGFWKLTRRNNIFFVSSAKLASQLSGQFPKLESININRNFRHGLILFVTERQPAGIWCQTVQNNCFYFDKNGVAFAETKSSSGFLITNVVDKRQREIKLGAEVITSDWFSKIISARDLLNKIGINITEFVIPADSFDEFYAQTAEDLPAQTGCKIMFSLQTNIEKQISALATFLTEKINPALFAKRAGLQYIDLRIQDRIYYK